MKKLFIALAVAASLPGCIAADMAHGINPDGCNGRVYCGINESGIIDNHDGTFNFRQRAHRWESESLIAQMNKEVARKGVSYCDEYLHGKKFVQITTTSSFEEKQHLWTDVEIKFRCE